jgi:hypothetical protein
MAYLQQQDAPENRRDRRSRRDPWPGGLGAGDRACARHGPADHHDHRRPQHPDRTASAAGATRSHAKAKPDDTVIFAPKPDVPIPRDGPVIDTLPLPQPVPQPLPQPQPSFTPAPDPLPSFAPRAANPRGRPGEWVTTNDYPARDLREGNQGITRSRC